MKISSLKSKGFSLIEMIIYIAVLAIIMVFIINTILSFTSSYRLLGALRAAENGGINSMETMTRTIRAASSITITGTTSTSVSLVATDNGNSTTTRFYLSGTTLAEDVNGTYYGPLTASNVTVNSIVFSLLSTTTSSALKIDMTLQGTSGKQVQTKSFHSTVVVKGS
jgi:prepilin-type N-terminal cleavage/methylation domain-containing protein